MVKRFAVEEVGLVLWRSHGGVTSVLSRGPGGLVVKRYAPPPCLDRESWSRLCDGYCPTCEPYAPVSEKLKEEGYAPYGCTAYGNGRLCSGRPLRVKRGAAGGRKKPGGALAERVS